MIFAQQLVGIRSADPLDSLKELKGIQVREKVNHIEALSALYGQEIEMANKYQVYAPGGYDDKFYAVETTGFVARNAKQLCGDCAPWSLDIAYSEGVGKEHAFHIDRPASWTCCCFNNPMATMTDKHGVTVGSMRDDSNTLCCNLQTAVLDPDGERVLKFDSGCCQWGVCCPLPCGSCSEIKFDIVDVETGAKVGDMSKKVPSLFKFLYAPDVDDYQVNFEGVERPEYKALIMAMTIFIDFRYFNDNTNDQGLRKAAIDDAKEKVFGDDKEAKEAEPDV